MYFCINFLHEIINTMLYDLHVTCLFRFQVNYFSWIWLVSLVNEHIVHCFIHLFIPLKFPFDLLRFGCWTFVLTTMFWTLSDHHEVLSWQITTRHQGSQDGHHNACHATSNHFTKPVISRIVITCHAVSWGP